MAIHEIRESINTSITNAGERTVYIVNEIDLQRGKRHTVNAIDVFIDNMWVNNQSEETLYGEVVLTSQPMFLTDQDYNTSYLKSTPQVGVDTILYKMQFSVPANTGVAQPITILQEFPNNFLGATPTFSWYTPKMYLYVVFYASASLDPVTISDIRISAYVAVDERAAAYVPYMLGNIREKSIAQIAKVASLGRMIPTSRIIGQTFPMYLYGGARAQLMMTSTGLANFYYQLDPLSAEDMLSTQQQRNFVAAGRAMVAFAAPFGSDLGGISGNVPDWVSLIALTGVVSGAVRDQWPAVKYEDNGNVRMM